MKHLKLKLAGVAATAIVATTFASVPLSRELQKKTATNTDRTEQQMQAGMPVDNQMQRLRRVRGLSSPFSRVPEVGNQSLSDSRELKRRVAASNVKLRGAMIDNTLWWEYPSSQEKPYGIYEFSPSAGAPEYHAVKLDQRFYVMDAIYTGEKLWISHAVEDPSTYQVLSMTYYTFDPNSWDVLSEQPGDKSLSLVTSTYVADDEMAYCTYYNNSHRFAAFSVDDGTLINIGALDKRLTAMAAHSDGTLYGMDESGNLVVINKNTGKVSSTVGNTGLVSYYRTSAAIDSPNNILYYVNVGQSQTSLYAVDLETAESTKLYDFEHAEQFIGLYVTADDTEPTVPAAATNLALDFEGVSLSGSFSFDAPATFYDGSTPSGSLSYVVKIDGTQHTTGSCAWGEHVSVPVTFEEPARHEFSVAFTNATGEGPASKVSEWIGPDAPAAPTGAKLTYSAGKFTISWTAPTAGANGGTIDPAAVTYKVVRNNDNTTVADGISATSVTDAVAEPVNSIVPYTYTITPYYAGLAGESVTTSKKSIGYIIPPYTNSFASSADISGYTVLDANKDSKKWSYNSASKAMRIQYNSSKAMDDYVFTPEILLEAGKTYTFTFDARAHNNSDAERVEAVISTGTTAASVVQTIIPATDIVSKEWITLSGTFTPDATRRYRFGIHGISDKNKYYLYATNITISEGSSTAAPAAIADLQATADASGALKAEITFTAPSADAAGQPLADLDRIELLRGDVLIKTWTSPAAGQTLTYTDTPAPPAGNVSYTAIAYNASGASAPAIVSTFIGFDVPNVPTQVAARIGSDSGEAVVEWTAPATDIRGKALSEADLTYTIVRRQDDSRTTVATGVSGTSFTDRAAAADAEQDFYSYEVTASSPGGNSTAVSTQLIPLGKPYEMPFRESFPNGRISFIWGLDSNNAAAGWLLGQDTSIDGIDSEDADNGLAIMEAMTKGSTATIYSGSIAVPAIGNPTLTFAYYNHNSLNKLSVTVAETGSSTGTVVAEITLDPSAPEGWVNHPVALDAFKGKNIQLYFKAEVVNTSIFVLDNIRVENRHADDLAVRSLSLPSRIATGSDYAVTASFENKGLNAAQGYTVALMLNGETIATKEGAPLAPAQAAAVTFDCNLPATNELEALTHKVEIRYAADDNTADNTSEEYTARPFTPEFPLPENVGFTVAGNDVSLSWDEPDLTVAQMQPVTDTAEDFTPYSTGLAGSEVFDDYVGGWTMIDGDGVTPFAITSQEGEVRFPNSGRPIGFMVFDASAMNLTEWAAHNGNNMFVSFASGYAPNDDWMISPMLSGESQTVSFWAKSLTDYYGADSFQVWYSSTDTRLSSFTRERTVDAVPTEWTKYEIPLPAGTRYFAIRCTSNQTFALFVDDITYIPAHPADGLVLSGYNVYRNGEKVASAIADRSYLDTDMAPADHNYRLSALYNRGESALTAPVTVVVTGIRDLDAARLGAAGLSGAIRVTGAAGHRIRVAATSGMVVSDIEAADNDMLIPAQPGIYIVSVAGKSYKITVK